VERCHNWLQAHAFEHPVEHMSACMLLITTGVLQRYPRLRIGFLESGAGWAGFWLHHLDEHYEKWHRFYPGLDELPSVYFQRQCFLGVEPDYALMPHLIAQGLGDTLLFSTDFPHFDAIFPGSAAALYTRTDLAEEQKRKILRDNALRFYGATV
jgi:predicted TIM-barrel fold metal-dependent hydrolase